MVHASPLDLFGVVMIQSFGTFLNQFVTGATVSTCFAFFSLSLVITEVVAVSVVEVDDVAEKAVHFALLENKFVNPLKILYLLLHVI